MYMYVSTYIHPINRICNPIKCLVSIKNLNLIGYTLNDEWAQIKNSLGETSD